MACLLTNRSITSMLKPFYKFAAIFAVGVIAGGLLVFLVAVRDDGGWFWQRHADLQAQRQQLRIRLETLAVQYKDLTRQLESANSIASIEESKRAAEKPIEINDADKDNGDNELLIAELLDKASGTKRPYLIADYDKAMLRLAEAGFSAFDAEVIIELESAAKEKIAALFEDRDSSNRREIIGTIREVSAQMHKALGDYGYENYLKANGQSPSVYIAKVADGTSGEQAGLKAGDRILRYGGERVFDIYELNAATSNGMLGEMVEIQVQRGEQINTMLIPRGVIGITSRPRMPAQFFSMGRQRQ